MKHELIMSGKTVEAAVEKAAQELGVSVDDVTVEVLVQPKKGFLGFGETLAQVKVVYNQAPIDIAVDFIETLIQNMELDAEVSVSDLDDGKLLSIKGDSASVLIGHHGETLDQLQYLVNLAANKKENDEDDRDYTKIMVDIEGYRTRREEALRALARRMAARVLKYRRNITMEPMSAYERRIIHSEVQNIDGVSTNSIGAERNRRVVIYLEGGRKPQKSYDEE
jgi:spoIIIJ-associated protein